MFSVKRELFIMRKAFKKQPIAQKIGKYVLFFGVLYLFRHSPYFWLIFVGLMLIAFGFHFFIRYKTKGWTKDYGLFKADDFKEDK